MFYSMRIKSIALFFGALSYAFWAGCDSGPSYCYSGLNVPFEASGRVVEEGTGTPLAATVTARLWRWGEPGLHISGRQSVLTDPETGEFSVDTMAHCIEHGNLVIAPLDTVVFARSGLGKRLSHIPIEQGSWSYLPPGATYELPPSSVVIARWVPKIDSGSVALHFRQRGLPRDLFLLQHPYASELTADNAQVSRVVAAGYDVEIRWSYGKSEGCLRVQPEPFEELDVSIPREPSEGEACG